MYEQEIDILNKFYVKLSINGWRRGTNQRKSGKCPRCILETFDALISEANYEKEYYKAVGRVEETMRYIIATEDQSGRFSIIPGDLSTASIIEWNDYKHRKIEHVFDLIDRCLSYYLSEREKPEVSSNN